MTRVLNLDVIRRAEVRSEPFVFISGQGLVRPETAADLRASFPDIRHSGFHPVDSIKAGGAFADLTDDLRDTEFGAALGEKFGRDFNNLPQLVTVRRVSAPHEGRAHTDGDKKVMSLLLYLNDAWTSPDGRLRLLRSASLDDSVLEIPPITGTFVAFLRSDSSWHGHTPFTGERRVVQAAWLRDRQALEKKEASHRLSGVLKRLCGG